MTTKRIAFGLVFALLVSVSTSSGQFKTQAGGAAAPSLEGSWIVDLTNQSAGSFKVLVTYDRGGGVVSTNPPVPPPFHASLAQGTWQRTGGHEFTNTFIALIYDPAGQFVATLKVRETLTLNESGDQYDSRASADVFDPAGNLIPGFSSCSQNHATRIKVEAPNASCL